MSGRGGRGDNRNITPIDADDARQYALDEIEGGEAKAKAHQEELPSDATINRC